MATKQRKDIKYTAEWITEVERMSVMLDGTETDDTKKKSKQLAKKIDEIKVLKTDIKKLEKEKTRKRSSADAKEEQANVFGRKLANELPKWEDFSGATPRSSGTTAGTLWSDGTNADGWNTRVKHWTDNITGGNNICKGKILKNTLGVVADTDIETTEEEAIALLSRAIKAFKGIIVGDFNAKAVGTKGGVTANDAQTYLLEIQAQAEGMVANKSFGREGYDIGYTYTTYDESETDKSKAQKETPYINDRIDWSHLVDLAKYINDGNWADPGNLNESKFGTEVEWKIYPKGDQYSQEELKNFVGNVSNTPNYFKTGLKKTGGSWVLETPITVKVKSIKDWAKLILSLDNNAIAKISASQPAGNDNIYQKLFKETRDWNTFTNDYTLDYLDDGVIKTKRDIFVSQASNLGLQSEDKMTEIDNKEIDIVDKEKEIDKFLSEIIAKKREELTTHKIVDGFELTKKTDDTIDKDNRRTQEVIDTVYNLLEDIRYLKNDGDATIDITDTTDTEKDKENTAFTKVKEIKDELMVVDAKIYSSWLIVEKTDEKRITKIKGNKTLYPDGLNLIYDEFKKKDNKVKLNEIEQRSFDAIQIDMGKKDDPTDTLKTFQDKLKVLDPLLDESVITKEVIDDFKTKENFKTSETVKALVELVIKDKKLDEDFKKVMVKEDADITDLANLFKKKKAKDVITLIKRFEYDNKLTAPEKEKTVKMIKMNMDKTKDDSLTEEETTTGIYKLAVSEYKHKSESDIKTWEGTIDTETKNGEKKWWDFGTTTGKFLWIGGGSLIVLGLGAAIFWKNISDWWNGSSEKEENENESTVSEEFDKE